MANENPNAEALLMMVQHAFEEANVLNIVLSVFLAAVIGRQPQLKDELIRLIEATPTGDENVARFKQKAREFIESIPAWIS